MVPRHLYNLSLYYLLHLHPVRGDQVWNPALSSFCWLWIVLSQRGHVAGLWIWNNVITYTMKFSCLLTKS
jgi:hypothetical protein